MNTYVFSFRIQGFQPPLRKMTVRGWSLQHAEQEFHSTMSRVAGDKLYWVESVRLQIGNSLMEVA